MGKSSKIVPSSADDYRFAGEYVKTGDRYKALALIHPESVGWPRDKQVQVCAAIIQRKGVIKAIAEMRDHLQETGRLSMDQHLARLDELGRKAEDAEDFKAAIKAEEMRGRAAGLYVTRSQSLHTHVEATPEEVRQKMRAMLAENPQLYRVLNIPVPVENRALEAVKPPAAVQSSAGAEELSGA